MTSQRYDQPSLFPDLPEPPEPEPPAAAYAGPLTWVVICLSHGRFCINIEDRVPGPSRRDVVCYASGDEDCEELWRWLGRRWTGNWVWFKPGGLFMWRVLVAAAKHSSGLKHPWIRHMERELETREFEKQQRRFDGPCPNCGYDERDEYGLAA